MKKKFVAVLLSALTAGSLLLSGCGGESSSGDSGSGSSGGDDTLTVMCVGTEADTYIDAYNAIAEKFSEDNEYGVTVEIEFYENEQYKTKLTTLMASNAVPDIFFTWELKQQTLLLIWKKTRSGKILLQTEHWICCLMMERIMVYLLRNLFV